MNSILNLCMSFLDGPNLFDRRITFRRLFPLFKKNNIYLKK